jgi:hypothetical protein
MIQFKAKIYKVGINSCVDVPVAVTTNMVRVKGYIKVKGTIHGFNFTKTLIPVKEGPFRLYVNMAMLKGSESKVGDRVTCVIEEDFSKVKKDYPEPPSLRQHLKERKLEQEFDNLTAFRKADILKYLSRIKNDDTLRKNIAKLIAKLEAKEKVIRIP